MEGTQGLQPPGGRRTLSRKDLLGWLSQPVNIIFLSLVVAHLLPIWSFPYFPSQDGPAHVENANILCNYSDPNASLLREENLEIFQYFAPAPLTAIANR